MLENRPGKTGYDTIALNRAVRQIGGKILGSIVVDANPRASPATRLDKGAV